MENLKHIFEAYSTIGFKTDFYNMTLSGFIKFASEAEIIQQREINNKKASGVPKSPVINRINYTSHKENKLSKLNEDYNYNVNYNTNYKKNNFNNNILGNLESEALQRKIYFGKSDEKKRSESFNSEDQKEKETISNNNNDSISQGEINNSNINDNSLNNANLNNNADNSDCRIPKSDLSVIYFYLCGLQNFDSSKRIRNHFDKNSGYNPNFENSLKGPCLDSKNLLKADKDLKPLKMNFRLFLE